MITDQGPDTAFRVEATADLPSSLTFNFCSSSDGSCNLTRNVFTFTMQVLEPGQSATATIFTVVKCSIAQSIEINNAITVESSGFDTDPINNSATATTTATNPQTTLNPTEKAFSAAGGNLSILANRGADCLWTSSSNASWININSSTNFGNGVVFYTVAANTGARRTGTMTIDGISFPVTQEGTCNVASIAPGSASFPGDGGTGQIDITAPGGCNWTASSNVRAFDL